MPDNGRQFRVVRAPAQLSMRHVRRDPRPRLAAAGGVVLLMLLTAGCATSDLNEPEWHVPAIEDPPRFVATTPLPLDAYRLADEDLASMQSAQARLLVECARDYGVDVTVSGDYLRPSGEARLMWGGRIGTMDGEHAAQWGYHPSPDGSWAPVGGLYLRDPMNLQPDPAANSDPRAEARIQRVMYGGSDDLDGQKPGADDGARDLEVPDGGCWRQVESQINSPLSSDLDTLVDLYNLALVDDRVVDAISQWSDCMSSVGFQFREVQEPGRSFTLAALTPEESSVAVADVRCTAESRWADWFYAVLVDYQHQALLKDPAAFASVLSSQQARLEALGRLVD